MSRYAQLVVGPAGSGKSTYCSTVVRHADADRRSVHVVNLDPAAESFDYPVFSDVRDLIQVQDVMEDEELRLGPNGGLVFCMEYLTKNFDWLEESLGDVDDDYFLFDCPGQIELYTHVAVMRQLVEWLQSHNFRVVTVFLVDAQFLVEGSRFLSAVLASLAAAVALEAPHVTVLAKTDLLSAADRDNLDMFLEPDMATLLSEELSESYSNTKFAKLTNALSHLVDDYSLVSLIPLDSTDSESVADLLLRIDTILQYGEEREPREMPDPPDEEDSPN